MRRRWDIDVIHADFRLRNADVPASALVTMQIEIERDGRWSFGMERSDDTYNYVLQGDKDAPALAILSMMAEVAFGPR